MSYRLWEEGKAPDFALEVASESTWREDLGRKRDLYAKLGIGEYWLFDPQGEFFDPPLRGLVLQNGEYGELPGRMENGRSGAAQPGLGVGPAGGGQRPALPGPRDRGRTLRTLEEAEARVRVLEAQLAAERRAPRRCFGIGQCSRCWLRRGLRGRGVS